MKHANSPYGYTHLANFQRSEIIKSCNIFQKAVPEIMSQPNPPKDIDNVIEMKGIIKQCYDSSEKAVNVKEMASVEELV